MKEGRLHMRLDERLLREIKKYAKRNRTTLSALTEKQFRLLLEADARRQDAEQL